MRNPVIVEKDKVDGSTTWTWEGDLVDGGDGWLAVHHEADRHRWTKRGEAVAYPGHVIDIAFTGQPLFVSFHFDDRGALIETKVDAALPSRQEARTLRFVDLDVDVVVAPDGQREVKDVEKFERNPRYTREHRDIVERALAIAGEALDTGAFPFDGTAERILGRVLAAAGPL